MWKRIYHTLERTFPSFTVDEWWGVTEPFARMAGSVLVQNTTWINASKALDRLEEAGLLEPAALAGETAERLAEVIRPAGFQRAKSAALLRLAGWVVEHGGVDRLRRLTDSTDELRRQLLLLKGIGPETADTILAYALTRPTISGDAYTRRLWQRLTGEVLSYEQVRRAILAELTEAEDLRRLHGLIVEHGKAICAKRLPRCSACLFADDCRYLHDSI
ncbi:MULTISPECIES: endonuclease III domain-containing protein [Brevibacillus]|jgi:endonuclease III related protein|uniref:Endonuclease n=1 Tax=Brevibacillus aydinogluensis TaxID=927786 RepID=A0AA48RDH4_9BACL|nr:MULTISPECIES: endonuclease [Bacillales]UFJ61238.1 endonuclease [Anoxybacillus sediminis]CAJ1001921.1 Endonuclease [Brevibacillus aydinogluensis]